MTYRRSKIWLAMTGLMLLTGCAARPLRVPEDARLLYYGPATNFRVQAPAELGQIYIFNESRNRVESVLNVTGDRNWSVSGLNPKNRYRIYFRPDDVVAPPAKMAPATEPPPAAERAEQ